ncbi:MAG: 3-mercaptopyruvate sulfurtransferase [Acidobacteria bacterium RIFCSPLOWO2_12_FULL_67_14]|nr:MAG: 3-mercaptopyruvate sulfurtransferase [Acidobacteria bacterium RIFCSPLOWO2_02_FULL_67_21]OFW39330.1 MAG: 3-mercaptopyruvate sulfurtransferase [Acidobacteria bacterium RIFCSPLOWO2_12_FULL_67_14]
MTYTTLVSTDTLASHLDGSWVIVDCRYDLQQPSAGREQYRGGHIPGAVYASLSHDLAAAPTGRNGRHPLPAPDAMAAAFGGLGISNDAQVIAYDEITGMFASRLWWMLRYLGHEAVAVLDGGFAKWVREGRAVRTGNETRPGVTFTGRPRAEMVVSLRDVESRPGNPARLLVDARAEERFAGRTEPLDRVPGHIPGAVSHHYAGNLTNEGTLRPEGELREEFTRLIGSRPPEDVVMYCGSGVSACQNLLALEHAGIHGARLYPGSYSEWAADPARPVEASP